MFNDHRSGSTVMAADEVIRVLHLVGTSEIGGTERFLIRLLQHLDRIAFTSRICVLDAPGRLSPQYAEVAEHVEHLDLRGRRLTTALGQWRRQVRGWAPHVLVLYGFRANLLGRLVRSRTPVVTALRSVFVDDRRRWSAAWLDRLTFRHVSVCVSNSRMALDVLQRRGYPPERLVHVPNAIDVAGYTAIDRAKARSDFCVTGDLPVLINVANLKPAKGHDTLLDASAQLNAAGVQHRLWLVGDGPERARLEQLSGALGLKGTVHFIGAEDDVRRRLAAADVAVMASRWEGMPTALLEAMASALPVVASRVGEIPDIVHDGVFGRLVPPDDPKALASALADVLSDQPRRLLWGKRATLAAQRFSLTTSVRQYEAIFRWAAQRAPVSELPSIAANGIHAQPTG